MRTIALVGEGYDECAFLLHVKSIYVPRGCGVSVVILNARGGGAEHVVEVAIKRSANANFDEIAALFDTDANWSEAVAKRAKEKRITTLLSTPCLEALLLHSIGQGTSARGTALKTEFRAFLGGSPQNADSYKTKFTRDVLEAAALRAPTLRALIDLLCARK